MSLDFLDSIMDAIENNVDLKDMKLRTAILKPESIALLLTPNNDKQGYQDGSYERSFSFNLNASSKQEMKVLGVLNAITAYFDNTEIESIQSLNNSFVLEDKEATSVRTSFRRAMMEHSFIALVSKSNYILKARKNKNG